MREQREEFSKLGVRLALVVQGTAAEAVRFCGRHGVVELCIPDPEKESYRAMGFFRTSFREILFPSAELRKRRAEAADAGCRVSLKGAFQKA